MSEPVSLGPWQAPDGLSRSSYRDVELSKGGILTVVLAVMMALGGIALGLFLSRESARERREDRQLAQSAAHVVAVVTDLTRGGKNNEERRVHYRFTVNGQEYTRRINAPRAIWNRLRVGNPLPVRYVASDPRVNRAEEWRNAPLPWWAALIACGALLFSAGMMLWMVRTQFTLLSEGRAARGSVTKISRGHKGGSVVSYEFGLSGGGVRKGRAQLCKPPVDGNVCVLYLPDNPRRNALYPLNMVRLTR